MTIVSHRLKLMFVHIPKTGGTSLYSNKKFSRGVFNNVLGPSDSVFYGHLPIIAMRNRYPEEFDEYFKFCFVRNPWDRLSSFFHGKKYGFIDRGGERPENTSIVDDHETLNDFIFSVDWSSIYSKRNHLTPQIKWMTDKNGKILVDHISKYENYNAEVRYVCKRISILDPNIPRNRMSENSRLDYRKVYSKETRKIIEEAYKEDIEKFGYSF